MGPHFLSLCQIWCNPSKNGAFCRLTDWIYFRWLFLSFGPLWVVAGDVSVKFYNCNAIYTADLLSFVKKYKMAAAAIMNCYLVTLYHPRSLLHGRNSVLKLHVNRITTFRAMVIWKFLQICLRPKTPIPAPKIYLFGGCWPPNIILRHRNPQKAHPWANPRRLMYTFNVYRHICLTRPRRFVTFYISALEIPLLTYLLTYIVKVRPLVLAVGDDKNKREGKERKGTQVGYISPIYVKKLFSL